MNRRASLSRDETLLDLLERENALLRGLVDQIDERRGSSVENRYDCGDLAKQSIQHLTSRQSSLMNVGAAISPFLSFYSTAERMIDGGTDRRGTYDEVCDLASKVEVTNLNQGQDFEGPLVDLIGAAESEIDWELAKAISLVRRSLSDADTAIILCSARYAKRHAPTRLSVKGPR